MTEGARAYDPPPHGTLADEAAKLADVAQAWLRTRATGTGEPWAAATDHTGTAPECRTCPICRARRFARSLDPEVLGHLSDAVASLGAAMAALSRKRRPGPR